MLSLPLPSTLTSEAVVCSHPESLYLLYEAGSIAMAGGGKDVFRSYFNAAARVVETRGECRVVPSQSDVTVTGYVEMTNPLRQDRQVIYGHFKSDGDSEEWAMISALPGLDTYARDKGILKAPFHKPAAEGSEDGPGS